MAEETSDASSARLAWPPLAEDLRRLYLEQKLSASKIATVYGLKYASAKTAESTILHHLKKNGISRRDPAAHVRKVTETIVDEWVARYQRGESLKQIAGDTVDAVTVFNHLRKRGLQLRDKVEAQIKAVTRFQKLPFEGSEEERAYLLGFARGDLNVKSHGRAIRIRTSSTHPSMIELTLSLFVAHGPMRVCPRFSKMVGYEWNVEGELDNTYAFLLVDRLNLLGGEASTSLVLSYLAGLFDAEGSVWLWKGRPSNPRMSFTNKNFNLLNWVRNRLSELGFHSAMNGPDPKGVYRLNLWRVEEIQRLLKILPIRHPEKKAKARIVIGGENNQFQARASWNNLVSELKRDRHRFILEAEQKLEAASCDRII